MSLSSQVREFCEIHKHSVTTLIPIALVKKVADQLDGYETRHAYMVNTIERLQKELDAQEKRIQEADIRIHSLEVANKYWQHELKTTRSTLHDLREAVVKIWMQYAHNPGTGVYCLFCRETGDEFHQVVVHQPDCLVPVCQQALREVKGDK